MSDSSSTVKKEEVNEKEESTVNKTRAKLKPKRSRKDLQDDVQITDGKPLKMETENPKESDESTGEPSPKKLKTNKAEIQQEKSIDSTVSSDGIKEEALIKTETIETITTEVVEAARDSLVLGIK